MNSNNYDKQVGGHHYDTARLNGIEFSLVAERYGGKVKRVGSNLYAECPWHDDEHPSLLIGGRKGNFCHCFSCGKSGSVIDYVMAVRNIDFKEACEVISRDYGIETLPRPLPLKGRGVGCGSSEVRDGRRKKSRHKFVDDLEVNKKMNEPKYPLPASPKGEGECQPGRKMGDLSSWYESYLAEHDAYGSSFVECLRSVVTEEGVRFAVEEYRLGCWPPAPKGGGYPDRIHTESPMRMPSPFGGRGAVMFPSIGLDGVVHNIKIQRYCTDKGSPRFFHKLEKSTYWLGAILRKQGVFAEDVEFDSGVFFGEHLLGVYPELPVVLVESPKNAVIGACHYTGAVWVAAGNKNNLTRQRMECLRNRRVIVIPDADALDEWKSILLSMKDLAVFEFSTFCDEALTKLGKKGDVADYLIKGSAHK